MQTYERSFGKMKKTILGKKNSKNSCCERNDSIEFQMKQFKEPLSLFHTCINLRKNALIKIGLQILANNSSDSWKAQSRRLTK